MNEQPVEMQEGAQEEQPTTTRETAVQEVSEEHVYADIVIWCHPKNVSNLVQAFQAHISNAAFPAFVLWSGLSGGRQMGVVILEWEGAVSGAFLHDLRRDFEVVDFVVYDWVRALQEQENRVVEAQDKPPLEQLQTIMERFRLRLDMITNLQRVPQIGEINAVLDACERVKALLPLLEDTPKSLDGNAQRKLQELPDQLTPLEVNAVFLRQVCQSDHLSMYEALPEIVRQQLAVRAAGKTLLLHLTEVQEALVEMNER